MQSTSSESSAWKRLPKALLCTMLLTQLPCVEARRTLARGRNRKLEDVPYDEAVLPQRDSEGAFASFLEGGNFGPQWASRSSSVAWYGVADSGPTPSPTSSFEWNYRAGKGKDGGKGTSAPTACDTGASTKVKSAKATKVVADPKSTKAPTSPKAAATLPGAGAAVTPDPTFYPTGYPTGFPTAYPTGFPTASPTASSSGAATKSTKSSKAASTKAPTYCGTTTPSPASGGTPTSPSSPSSPSSSPASSPSSTTSPGIVTDPSVICAEIEEQNLLSASEANIKTALANIESSTSGLTADTSTFDVGLSITYSDPITTRSEVITVLDGVNAPLALWVAGCEDEALAYLNRRLQSGDVGFVWFDDWANSGSGDNCGSLPCTESFTTEVDVRHSTSIDSTEIAERIAEAFDIFASLINGVNGISYDADSDTTVTDTTDDGDRIVSGNNSVDDSVSVGTVVGAVAGGLALVLLLVLLVRGNRDGDEVSHHKLDDDEGDDTFIREFETTASNYSREEPYESRNVHVVGEADSIFSGWTGYTGNKEGGVDISAMNPHERGDVHKCSSATCEVCERNRQRGIQFVPTRTPPRPAMPSNAARVYVAEDTVEL